MGDDEVFCETVKMISRSRSGDHHREFVYLPPLAAPL